MPDSKDCGQRDFSRYDAMSTQQLQQLLREDVFKSEGEETDTAEILDVMEVLAARKKEQKEGKTPAEALESFKKEYDINHNLISENREKNRKKCTQQLWKRGLAAAIALAILVLGCSVTADAFGIDLWETIAKWTQETFHFGYAGETNPDGVPDGADSKVYEGLKQALEQTAMYDLRMPTWMPAGYEEVQVDVFETPRQRQVIAFYQMNEGYIQIKITDYLYEDPEKIEQNGKITEKYEQNGIDCYIFEDNGTIQAVWLDESYECYITGTLSLAEIKLMIDSVEKG